MRKRKKVIQGGTWAGLWPPVLILIGGIIGKTFAITSIIINLCASKPNRDVTVVAESIPALKAGALKDFVSIMKMTGRWFEPRYNYTDRIYTFANGSVVKFNSFDSEGKAKAAGKRTDLFINEANHIPFRVADTLITRTSGNVWIDFNPNNEFWVHQEMVGRPNVDFIILKYTDNESLPESIKEELMEKKEKAKTSKYWENWCRVYIDGEIGSLEGVVFTNWQIVDLVPETRMIGYGLDFGYANDPTALIPGYVVDGTRLFDEVMYESGLLNSDISRLAKQGGIQKHNYGYADSAEPKSIAELNRLGLTVKAATKGRDSINFGIGLLQEEPFYVTSRSVNLIKELRNYRWDVDREGNQLNRPIDAYNHAIDAMRYLAIEKFTKKKSFTISAG